MSPSPGDLFTQYGKRTSMHGWSHIYQSNDYKRRSFWFVLAVMGSLATTLHIYKTLHTYFETPVNSRKLVGTIDSIFPDVTVCNSEMIPTIILKHDQGKAYFRHLRKKYNMFRDVLVHRFDNKTGNPYPQSTNEQNKIGDLRLDDWQTVNNLFASEDILDISLPFSSFIMECKFMRSKNFCQKSEWTLVQNARYGNCYTFHPKKRSPLSSDSSYGLVLYIYVGDFSIKTHLEEETVRNNATHISLIEASDRFQNPHNEYPDFVRILNHLHPPIGVRVLVHEQETYPDVRREGLDVGSGQIADITFAMEHIELVNHASRPCDTHAIEERKIRVLRGFQNNHTHITPLWNTYRNSTNLCVGLSLQAYIFKQCGCYTHLYPTIEGPEKYCFFVPFNMSKKMMLNVRYRILCHNKLATRLANKIPQLNKDCIKEQPCHHNYYHLSTLINPWPSLNNIQDLMTFTVIPALTNKSIQINPQHQEGNSTPIHPLEHVILGNITHWRTTSKVLRKNFVKVRVFPQGVTGNEHREVPSYHFAEALSEIGGIFGLWVGMSLLTFFEFLELFVLMVSATVKSLLKQQKDYRGRHGDKLSSGNKYLPASRQSDDTPQHKPAADLTLSKTNHASVILMASLASQDTPLTSLEDPEEHSQIE